MSIEEAFRLSGGHGRFEKFYSLTYCFAYGFSAIFIYSYSYYELKPHYVCKETLEEESVKWRPCLEAEACAVGTEYEVDYEH